MHEKHVSWYKLKLCMYICTQLRRNPFTRVKCCKFAKLEGGPVCHNWDRNISAYIYGMCAKCVNL